MKCYLLFTTLIMGVFANPMSRYEPILDAKRAKNPYLANYFDREPGDEKKPFGDVTTPYRDSTEEADVHAVLGE